MDINWAMDFSAPPYVTTPPLHTPRTYVLTIQFTDTRAGLTRRIFFAAERRYDIDTNELPFDYNNDPQAFQFRRSLFLNGVRDHPTNSRRILGTRDLLYIYQSSPYHCDRDIWVANHGPPRRFILGHGLRWNFTIRIWKRPYYRRSHRYDHTNEDTDDHDMSSWL